MKIYLATSTSKVHNKTLKEMGQEDILLSYFTLIGAKEEKEPADVFGQETVFGSPEITSTRVGIPRDRRG